MFTQWLKKPKENKMPTNDELNLIVTDNDIGYKDKMQAYLNIQAQNYIALSTKNLVAVGNSATGSDLIIQDLGANYSTQEALIEQTIKISSSSTNDAGSGTGAKTVLLSGYDKDYNEQSETIILNGQTAVNTTKKYILVRELEVLTAGTGLTNAGTVYAGVGTVTSGVPATKYLGITAGIATTRVGFYLVPAGYKMVIKKSELQNRTATNACLLKLWVKKFGSNYVQKYLRNVEGNSITSTNIEYVLPEKTLIKITGNNGTSTSAMIINIEFYLVKK